MAYGTRTHNLQSHSPSTETDNALEHNKIQNPSPAGMRETMRSTPESTISEASPEADAVALARAITAINELHLPPEVKANLVRRLAGV